MYLTMASNSGSIVPVTWSSSTLAYPCFAVEGLAEALRYEVASFGVSVSLLEPGDFQTGVTSATSTLTVSDWVDAGPITTPRTGAMSS